MFNLSTIDGRGEARIYGLASKKMSEALVDAVKIIAMLDDLVMFSVIDADAVEPLEIEKWGYL